MLIPYGRQSISKEDMQAVHDVLCSDYLTQGPVIPEFEKAIAEYVSASYAVAVSSGTAALHIACLALGLTKGDWLWTSPITFVASANCGLYCGAKVDFVDIDPDTFNMSVSALSIKLEQAEKKGTLPKVIIPVHFAGQSCEMQAIALLAKKYGIKLIEDACHALGSEYQNKRIGCCQYSDITVYSFHPVKMITTGEGGMAVTNQKSLAKRMRLLACHGITRDIDEMSNKPDGAWYYQQIELGFNYRMTDIQAALGLSQLSSLPQFIQQRKKIAQDYDKGLKELPLKGQIGLLESNSSRHLYTIRLNIEQLAKTHLQVFNQLREKGIGANLHYIPVHMQPFYQQFGFCQNDFPEAEKYYQEAISLPIFPDLTESQQLYVIEQLKQILRG